jgi:exopolyphosphatase/guanosine-5'-triphosphate,3'-diphosphate pyrophosphatase
LIENRIGIIDIGTNTFNLLVVDKVPDGFEKIYSTKVGVGLGLGGINEARIAQDAMERGIATLADYLNKCQDLEVSKVKAFATSAVRDAENKEDFLTEVSQLGLDIEVISGNREAELIYEGVKMGYPFDSSALIMDIGGGSTEFILADSDGVKRYYSFNIGTSRIYQLFDFEDPYSEANVQKVIDFLEEKTAGFFNDVDTEVLIGASGSFETFYAILNEEDYPENEFEDMPAEDVLKVLDEMIFSSLEEREQNDFIIPIRKKMAPIAAIKIKWIMEKLNIKVLTISPFAMKEGVIKLL